MRAALVMVLGLAPMLASAQWAAQPSAAATGVGQWAIKFASDGTPLVSRSVSAAAGGAVNVLDKIGLSTPRGTAFEVTAGRVVSSAAARSALSYAVRAIPYVGTAAIAYSIWQAYKDQGVVPDSAGTGLWVDPGSPYTQNFGFRWFVDGKVYSAGNILSKAIAYNMSTCQNNVKVTCTVTRSEIVGAGSSVITVHSSVSAYNSNGSKVATYSYDDTLTGTWQNVCGDTTQPNLKPIGTNPCPSDVRRAPTEAEVGTATNAIPAAQLPDLYKEAAPVAEKRGLVIPYAPPSYIGPTEIAEKPTVTTQPDGSTKTQTRVWVGNYGPDGIVTLTPRDTVVDATASGTTTGTTTTTNPQDKEFYTDCDKYKDSLGCAKVGSPSEVNLPSQSVPINASPDEGWGFNDASCPAPRTVQVLGVSATLDNSLLCSFFSGIRFAVLGAFGLVAVMVFLGGLKS